MSKHMDEVKQRKARIRTGRKQRQQHDLAHRVDGGRRGCFLIGGSFLVLMVLGLMIAGWLVVLQ